MNDNKITHSNIYSFNKYLKDNIMPKFFKVDDSNLLRLGVLGYINELITNTTEVNAYKISELMGEIDPNTAKLPETTFANASFIRYEDFFATPARLPIALSVNIDSLLKNMAYSNNSEYGEFILDNNSEIIIGDFTFMLRYNIRITVKRYNNNNIFTAMYIIDDENNDYRFKIPSPYLKTLNIKNEKGQDYLYILTEAYQMKKIIIEKEISTENIIDMLNFDLDFTGDLTYFNAMYKEPGATSYVSIKKLLTGFMPINEKFCYYKYMNKDKLSSTLNIGFSDRFGFFVPEFNSKFSFELFVTDGEDGNFTYVGTDTRFVAKSEKYDYHDLIFFVNVFGNSIDGKRSKDIYTIQKDVANSMITLEGINTDNDLNYYFQKKNLPNVKFFKRRDDFLKRVFSAFLLITDDVNKKVLHTNTLSAIISKNDFNINISDTLKGIKCGSLFKYQKDDNSSVNIVKEKDILPDDIIFTNPYLMVLDYESSILSIYNNNISKNIQLKIDYVNSNSYVQTILSSFNIERLAILGDDSYVIHMNASFNMDIHEIMHQYPAFTIANNIKILALFDDRFYKEFTIGDYDSETDSYKCQMILKTDDTINNEGKLRISEGLYDIKTKLFEKFPMILMANSNIKIYSFIRYPDDQVYGDNHGKAFNDILAHFSLSSIYANLSPLNFVESMNNFMNSQILFKKNDPKDNDYVIDIFDIPFIRNDYKKDKKTLIYIYNFIDNYIYSCSKILECLDNTNIDIKLYNTYGKPRTFTCGVDKKQLDKINVKLHFNVRVRNYNDINMEDYKKKLQLFIQNYIENINLKLTNSIYISNLTREIELNFPDVVFVSFVNINDYDSSVQIIENSNTDIQLVDYNDIHKYVPEYLNVNYIFKDSEFIPEVYIDFI